MATLSHFKMKPMHTSFNHQQIIDYVKANLQRFKDMYSESALMQKLSLMAKTAGTKTIYMVLKVYYAMKSKDVPVKYKIILGAALGYFIAPFDLIPDIFGVLGIVDDGIILKWALDSISAYITPEMENEAKAQLLKWFPKANLENLDPKPESSDLKS